MNHSLKTGISFGITSGIITTLGLMVGLHSGTHSRSAVIGGILVIAIADAFSDAMGIHISEESENKHNTKEIWSSTASTFLSKFLVTLTFVIPALFIKFPLAIFISVIWGLFLLSIFSWYISKGETGNPWKVVFEHLIIALIVIVITHFIGDWIGQRFG